MPFGAVEDNDLVAASAPHPALGPFAGAFRQDFDFFPCQLRIPARANFIDQGKQSLVPLLLQSLRHLASHGRRTIGAHLP